MNCKNLVWTKPHLGVSHCGEFGKGNCWVTITEYSSTFVTLGFCDWKNESHPNIFGGETEKFDNIEDAKKAGEEWLQER